jgi:hypothetical protein
MAEDSGARIYEFDPDAAPDDHFEPGQLRHVVEGNQGRLLDARRTPVTVLGVDLSIGMFEVEVGAFEDAGARWRVPLEEVDRFQFARGQAHATPSMSARYEAAVDQFRRPLEVAVHPDATDATRRRIAHASDACRRHLDALRVPPRLDPKPFVDQRKDDPDLASAVRSFLAERDLDSIDEAFVAQYVSNPWSGELIKGHAIVAAELGLAPYRGGGVRDERLFDGYWSHARRADHLIARLGVSAELWRRAGEDEVTLYRAITSEAGVRPPTSSVFVSATFSRDVADAHFAGGQATRSAAIYRQAVAVERILMTFWETTAMNEPFAEAEAILLNTSDGLF